MDAWRGCGAGVALGLGGAPAQAQSDWKPTKPVEFVGAAGPGGGTDIFARAVQLAIQNNKLIDQPILVSNKGGSGAETFVYVKAAAGDGHKLAFGTSNLYTLPMVAKVAFKHTDFEPVAAMVFDEFVLWNKGDSPYNDYKSFTAAAKAANEHLQDGGRPVERHRPDPDPLHREGYRREVHLCSVQERRRGLGAAHGRTRAVPRQQPERERGPLARRAGEGAVRLLEGADAARREDHPDPGWGDIPTCKEQGRHRGLSDAAHRRASAGHPKAAVDFWADVLKKVTETPEWKDYLEKTAQTGRYMAEPTSRPSSTKTRSAPARSTRRKAGS